MRALPIATVATGTPAGICTIESSESMPSRYFSGTGTPITGSGVTDGEHAGQVGRSAGAGDDHLQPAAGGLPAVGEHLVGHPVRGDHVGLVGDVELGERLGGGLHHRPVGVRAHHDADTGVDSVAHSLALVAQVSAEPRGGVPGALEAVVEVVAVGVDVPDLAARAQLLAVEVHPQVRVARHRVRVAVVQAAGVVRVRPGC